MRLCTTSAECLKYEQHEIKPQMNATDLGNKKLLKADDNLNLGLPHVNHNEKSQ